MPRSRALTWAPLAFALWASACTAGPAEPQPSPAGPTPQASPVASLEASPSASPEAPAPSESPVTAPSPPPPHVPRREPGPGMSEGQLSAEFTEVEVEVSSSFAHDAGMQSSLKSLSVGGETCVPQDLLKELVALRKGWTISGGSSEEEVLATFKAFVAAWGAIFPYSGRLTGDTQPRHFADSLRNARGPASLAREGDEALTYHPPRFAIYALDDGDALVVHSYFQTWDGGNHGTQMAYSVEAYRVSDGSSFDLSEKKAGLVPAPEKSGPQPVDPKIPRPKHLTHY